MTRYGNLRPVEPVLHNKALKLVLFKFNGDKIYEERWFIDTVQWKSAFH